MVEAILVTLLALAQPTYIHQPRIIQAGVTSWYGPGFHGRRTASRSIYDQNGLTAAHRTLPFGTRVLVTVPSTGRSVTVTVTDRGPFVKGRILDLSRGAAVRLGIVHRGVAYVELFRL